jgi:hypothetical protein
MWAELLDRWRSAPSAVRGKLPDEADLVCGGVRRGEREAWASRLSEQCPQASAGVEAGADRAAVVPGFAGNRLNGLRGRCERVAAARCGPCPSRQATCWSWGLCALWWKQKAARLLAMREPK